MYWFEDKRCSSSPWNAQCKYPESGYGSTIMPRYYFVSRLSGQEQRYCIYCQLLKNMKADIPWGTLDAEDDQLRATLALYLSRIHCWVELLRKKDIGLPLADVEKKLSQAVGKALNHKGDNNDYTQAFGRLIQERSEQACDSLAPQPSTEVPKRCPATRSSTRSKKRNPPRAQNSKCSLLVKLKVSTLKLPLRSSRRRLAKSVSVAQSHSMPGSAMSTPPPPSPSATDETSLNHIELQRRGQTPQVSLCNSNEPHAKQIGETAPCDSDLRPDGGHTAGDSQGIVVENRAGDCRDVTFEAARAMTPTQVSQLIKDLKCAMDISKAEWKRKEEQVTWERDEVEHELASLNNGKLPVAGEVLRAASGIVYSMQILQARAEAQEAANDFLRQRHVALASLIREQERLEGILRDKNDILQYKEEEFEKDLLNLQEKIRKFQEHLTNKRNMAATKKSLSGNNAGKLHGKQ